ncbi:hypothetical protein OL548_11125 [Lysinibacillus sp. MHQ-1]|nr:hypothetical protein OL548_11125 [Lysinibacillus sp. MHQ-1]
MVFFVLGNLLSEQEKDYGQRAMLVARTVSNVPELSVHLNNDNIKESAKKY